MRVNRSRSSDGRGRRRGACGCSSKQSLDVTCASSAPPASGRRSAADAGVADGGWRRAGARGLHAAGRSGPGGILFAVSGEVLALDGYQFPPANPGDPAFVDGWEVHFTRLLVTVDKITLSNEPDVSPGDQSLTGAARSPRSTGPGRSIWRTATRATCRARAARARRRCRSPRSSTRTSRAGNAPASTPDGTRYAFGFDVVPRDGRAP